MYQWFILVKYQKYIIILEAIKSPLGGGLWIQNGEGRNKKPGAGPGSITSLILLSVQGPALVRSFDFPPCSAQE